MDSLFIDEVIIRTQQRFKKDHYRVYTEEVNKTALSSNDDKRLQTFDKVTTFPYGTPAVKVCESQMKMKMMMKMQNETCESKIENVDVQNDIYESAIDNADNVDNVNMQNEICKSKIGNMDIVNISTRPPKIKIYELVREEETDDMYIKIRQRL